MANCRLCKHNYKPSTCEPKCARTCDGESDFEPITNGDKIRKMSDEELAEFFNQHDCVCDFCTFNMGCLQHETVRCKEGFLNWLKSPTTD